MKSRSLSSRLMASLAVGALLAAMPMTIQLTPAGIDLSPSFAHAKDGRDDRGGDDRGGDDRSERGSDDRSGRGGGNDRADDDHGGRGRGGDDRAGDDRDGRGRGGDDRGGDDHGRRGRGGDDARAERNDDRGGDKVEITANGVEVVHSDGTKEEIRNGRYERKDAAGRTVEERRATARDLTRLSRGDAPAPAREVRVGFVTKVEAQAGNVEVLYSTGWREEIENGRYELKDPNNNTVVERPARPSDIARLQQVAAR